MASRSPSQEAIEQAALRRLGIPLKALAPEPAQPATNATKLKKKALRVQKMLVSRGSQVSKKVRDGWKRTLIKAYRAAPPPAERKVLGWMKQHGFEHQLLVCGFIADFGCRSRKLLIELDGGSHVGREGYDQHRDSILTREGWQVVRFPNELVFTDVTSFHQQVLRQL
jgi:very-short-patch-repair endonuclease